MSKWNTIAVIAKVDTSDVFETRFSLIETDNGYVLHIAKWHKEKGFCFKNSPVIPISEVSNLATIFNNLVEGMK